MELSNAINSVKFLGSQQVNYSNPSQRRMMSNDNYYNDCYVKKPSSVPLDVEKLFPNGEFEKIYSKIVSDYGIKNPPKIIWAPTGRNSDACFNGEENQIYFDINRFSELQYKNQIEYIDSNSQTVKGYQPSGTNILAAYRTKEEFNRDVKQDCDRLNIKTQLVPLTDDDKRKLIIFKFAHELGHAFQNQTVLQTEGLSLHDMIKNARLKYDKNFLSLSKFLATWDKKFEALYGKENKKYSLDSVEGQYAQKVHDAILNYPFNQSGSSEYYKNFIEIDANVKAYKYLKTYYNGFDNVVDLMALREYASKKNR